MHQSLLIYCMILYAAAIVLFLVRSKVPARWHATTQLLMAQFVNLGFAVSGASYIADDVNSAPGWLLIFTATVGSVLIVVKPGNRGSTEKFRPNGQAPR
jgi:hypothetical protein